MVKTHWLSMHVPYGCRHSGVCCSSGWAIPIERTRTAAVAMLRGDGSWLLSAPGSPPDVAGTLAVTDTGHCVFHRDRCEIQRAYGHAALPSACQHFPREVLIDGRGVSVTLSHYCPTAVDLLFDHVGPVAIVEGPPAIPMGDSEGLDARNVLPPLLIDGVLTDLEGYSAWEAHMVRVLTVIDGRTPEAVLGRLEIDLAVVQRWRPGRRSLADEISRLPGDETTIGLSRSSPRIDTAAGPGFSPGMNMPHPPGPGFDLGESAGPGFLSAEALAKAVSPGIEDRVIRRYLAARAFASWMAYQGGGVAAVLRSLRFALSLLRDRRTHLPLREAIRQTDLQILHLMPREALAAVARGVSP
jgi:hypothetical protein